MDGEKYKILLDTIKDLRRELNKLESKQLKTTFLLLALNFLTTLFLSLAIILK